MLYSQSVEYAFLICEQLRWCIELSNASLIQHQDSVT